MKDIRKTHLGIVSGLLRYTTEYFHANGFTQLMPVILSPVTDPLGPDPGSTVIKTGEVEYLGQRLSLTQSMILHKQIAIREGIEKLFIISPNVRLEHPKRKETGKHLFEFSQVDFEIAYGTKDDVFKLMESFVSGAVSHMKIHHAEELESLDRRLPLIGGPFKRYTTHELKDKYGDDWEMIASKETTQPFWVLDHSREFYDKEDPDKPGHYINYDMIYPEGFCEGLSGAEREHEYDIIIKKIEKHGLDKTRYGPYLDLAKTGLTPSAGGGFGVERLARYITGAKHIGDVQLFRRVPGEPVVV
ncbi:Asparagine--tRNA ligase [Candidatus Bilamarchaeum dharawalense]|uniref:Asparagine--tRNA ligase n=1 Tax=Candidatus Bilamarchaeum dharawalense TaxID=2885759 RepID=A0A5E4LM57_9ARCH|nr:Asparagine--tRNA ligase [Candidatus Bilamarchaeum dharawalense]